HKDVITSDQLHLARFWPNPANENLNISFISKDISPAQLRMLDLMGQELMADEFVATIGLNKHSVKLADLPEGTYMVQIKTNGNTISKMIVVVHPD
ncbi:MAG: T9SS type A sorting domain-containing protein, partial [Bacteroidota bacterium]|nr:T9SS type A sorting domain-containing protein [Bacteroidota bacterium]